MSIYNYHKIKSSTGDFPSGPIVENLPCSAGDEGLIPGQGIKIPHDTSSKKKLPQTLTPPHSQKINSKGSKELILSVFKECKVLR